VSDYRILRIDESSIDRHDDLDIEDECYYLGDYAASQGYNYSEFNQLIHNLKKPMDRITKADWSYKMHAISNCAELIVKATSCEKLKQHTWVPMPPSKKKDHSEFDDRLLKILVNIKQKCGTLDIRELLHAKFNLDATHYIITTA